MLAYRLPCKFGNRHKVGEAHILAQASVKDNSARFPIFEMIHALRLFNPRKCQSQRQKASTLKMTVAAHTLVA